MGAGGVIGLVFFMLCAAVIWLVAAAFIVAYGVMISAIAALAALLVTLWAAWTIFAPS